MTVLGCLLVSVAMIINLVSRNNNGQPWPEMVALALALAGFVVVVLQMWKDL